MNIKPNYKNLAPYVAGILIFLITVFIYFGPLWQGKQVSQHDKKTFEGMSKEVVDYRNSHDGKEALWTNSMFGGMPAYQISVAKKENLIRYIDKYLFRLNLPRPADYAFLYMVGFFLLLLILGVDPWLSIIGALAFGFSSYFYIILQAGHNSKAHAIGYMAPTLAFIIYTFKSRKYILGGALFSLFMALELYTNHPQITYYLMFIVLAYGIAEFFGAIKEKQLVHFGKAVSVLVIGLILAIAVNTENYWTTLEYSPYTIRGKSELSFDKHTKSSGLDKDYATQWSYGKGETFTLLIPDANGGASVPIEKYAPKEFKDFKGQYKQYIGGYGSYFGTQPMTSGPVYVGAIVMFFFILGLFIIEGRFKWALLGVTIISIMLSWGHNLMWFTDIFFDYFPAYNKFRTVSMILVITELTTVLLAFLALNKIIKEPQIIKEKSIGLYVALAATAGISLLFYFIPETFFTFLNQQDQSQLIGAQQNNPQQAAAYQAMFNEIAQLRINIFKADSIRSFIFVVLAAALIWVYSIKKFNKAIVFVGLGVLILFDMVGVDRRYLNDSHYERKTRKQVPYRATPADLQISQDKELDYRVFNTTVSTFNDASTSYYHKSIGGYHGAKLRRYQDLIEHHLSVGNMEVLNMLNTKYFIVGGQGQAPSAQKNPERLGNAWFVKRIQMVPSADQEIIHLGKVLKLKALGNIDNLSIYGRPLHEIDTLLATSPINIGESASLNLSRMPIEENAIYILGNDPQNTDSNFIDISGVPGGNLLAKRQFEVQVIFDFKAKDVAVVNEKFKSYLDKNKFNYLPSATISLTDYEPNYLKYATHAQSAQLAIFSEIYYNKGWNAFIDGKPAEYIQADYVLRSMVIPEGDHIIEFKFEPKSYFIGSKITLASSLILILLVAGVLFFEIKGKNKN
jgi:hypothetical protein